MLGEPSTIVVFDGQAGKRTFLPEMIFLWNKPITRALSRLSLKGAALRGLKLGSFNFEYINFENAALDCSTFLQTNMSHANFENSSLELTKFFRTDLDNANLKTEFSLAIFDDFSGRKLPKARSLKGHKRIIVKPLHVWGVSYDSTSTDFAFGKALVVRFEEN